MSKFSNKLLQRTFYLKLTHLAGKEGAVHKTDISDLAISEDCFTASGQNSLNLAGESSFRLKVPADSRFE